MITLADIQASTAKIAPYVTRTPLWKNTTLSRELNTNVYLKMELFQKSGSFKPRGAFYQMLQLSQADLDKGVVAVSGGNFAQGVAYASQVLGVDAIICMPQNTPENYVAATKSYGATIELLPDVRAAFDRVDELTQQGRTALHPFDNPNQMAGVGTIGLEIFEDLPEITDLVVSIGGGGLLSGVTIALKSLKPSMRIWGVETEGSETMRAALDAGKVVEIIPTSLAKTLSPPYVAHDAMLIAQRHLEQLITVSDKEAINEQRFLVERAKIIPELAASCTLAAARKIQANFEPDDHVVLLMCGGNDSVDNLIRYASIAG